MVLRIYCKEKIKNRNKKEKVNSFTEQNSLAFFSGGIFDMGSETVSYWLKR